MAKQTVISNIHKNCMGTISFDFIGGNLRKEQEFITYPIDKRGNTINFQSDKRWMVLTLDTRELFISVKGNTSWEFNMNGSTKIDISEEQIETILGSIRGTSSIQAGKLENGVMQCDNGSAHLI